MPERLRDRVWRLNNLYWIVDKKGRRVMFRPNWYQQQLIENMHYFNIILKGRQLGITTFWNIFALDSGLFNSNFTAGIIAHNREDAQEIFQRNIKYPYEQFGTDENGKVVLPELKEHITASQDSARKLMLSNNSSIRVGTSMRSGTVNFLHVTEHGKICAKYPEKAKEIKTGSLNTVHEGQMIVIESTSDGRDGDFYDFYKGAEDRETQGKPLEKMQFKPFFFPWWRNPEYATPGNQPIPKEHEAYFKDLKLKEKINLSIYQKTWYVLKYESQQDMMKQEFPSTSKEAFEKSIHGAYYSTQMLRAREQKRVGFFPHNPQLEVHTAWDLGISDEMAIWFFQLDGQAIYIIRYYENTGEGLEHYIQEIRDQGFLYGKHFGPHDIKKRDLISGKDRISRAAEMGLIFDMIPRTPNVVEDVNEVRRMFNRFHLDESNCEVGIKCLDHYRKEWNDKLSCFRETPLHDWASNGADALRTLIHGVMKIEDKPKPKPQRPRQTHKLGWMG